MNQEIKNHWEKVFATKKPNEVSWTQEVPAISLEFINQLKLPKSTKIIDVGGGDSKLVDYLLDLGYTDITVLDISEKSLERAKARLGERSNQVAWIVSDILDFQPNTQYQLWHDRAAFHFLTEPEKVNKYLSIVKNALKGNLIIGTFSVDGPTKCSGFPVQQYDEPGMKQQLENVGFINIACKRDDHITPSGQVQNFVFCSFIN